MVARRGGGAGLVVARKEDDTPVGNAEAMIGNKRRKDSGGADAAPNSVATLAAITATTAPTTTTPAIGVAETTKTTGEEEHIDIDAPSPIQNWSFPNPHTPKDDQYLAQSHLFYPRAQEGGSMDEGAVEKKRERGIMKKGEMEEEEERRAYVPASLHPTAIFLALEARRGALPVA
ncbi:hypothetical protein BJ165DRAFT_1533996 [Panaeolus papilionaceus]|nr:hypothetical protein BJ165DRAFT_1533996 [Panaeolus papilionaceus]